MTRSEALDIVESFPKTLEDIAVRTEQFGVEETVAALEDVGIDAEAFLMALEDDLIDACPDVTTESLRDQLSEWK